MIVRIRYAFVPEIVIFPSFPQSKCYKIEFYGLAWLVRLIQTVRMNKKVHEFQLTESSEITNKCSH